MKKVYFFTKKKGFSTVEIMLAFAMLSIIIAGIISVTISATSSISDSNEASVGSLLAEEAFEIIRNLRDDDFANLTDGIHGLAVNGASEWELTGTPDVADGFTRTIEIQTIDAVTKQVDVSIDWTATVGGNKSISFTNYYKDIYREIILSGDWANSTIRNSIDISGSNNGQSLILEGTTLYAGRNGGNPEFIIYDTTDIDNFIELDTVSINGNVRDIVKSGNYIYVAGTGTEIQVVDVTDPTDISVVDSLNLSGGANMRAIDVYGNNLIATRDVSGEDEYYVIDISDPTNINTVLALDYSDRIRDIKIVGTTLFGVTDLNSAELILVDLTNVLFPFISDSIDLAGGANGYAIDVSSDGNTAFVGRAGGEIHVINTLNKSSILEISEYSSNGNVYKLDFDEASNLLFAAYTNATQNFQVIDMSNLIIPTQFGGVNNYNGNRAIVYDASRDIAITGNTNNSNEIIIYEPN